MQKQRNALLGTVLALTVALGTSPAKAEAGEVYHGFAVQRHYVIEGGTPATFEQVAENPLGVFRSEVAYTTFRVHLAGYLGRPVSDADFRSLMRSDRVRLVDCEGPIDTAGITDFGRVDYHERACYTSRTHGVEKLIQLRLDDGSWVTVGSSWCYNPVRGEVPSRPPPLAIVPLAPAPPPYVQRLERTTRSSTEDNSVYLGAFGLEDCDGVTFYGGFMVRSANTNNSTTYLPAN